MYIESTGSYARDSLIQSDADRGTKRTRDNRDDGGNRKRLRHDLASDITEQAPGFDLNGPGRTKYLTELIPDVLSVIAGLLSLSEFAKLAGVCKALHATPWAPQLGREIISAMGAAVSGRDILSVVQSETAMRADWRSTLYLSFARKVQAVELHDHAVLFAAWQSRLAALESDGPVMAYPDARNDFDTLKWFLMPPSQHEETYLSPGDKSVAWQLAIDASSLKALPASCYMRVLERLPPRYNNTPLRALLIKAVCEAFPNHWRIRPGMPSSLIIDIATELLGPNHDMLDLRFELSLYLGVSDVDLDLYVGPAIAERMPALALVNARELDYDCDRWNPGDTAFRRAAEDVYLEELNPRRFREVDFERLVIDYESDALQQDMHARIRSRLFEFETFKGAIFRGDAELAAQVSTLSQAIAHADDTTFKALCDAAQKLPYRVGPFLMQQLASRVGRVLDGGSAAQPLGQDKAALFTDFLLWRDRIVASCNESHDWDLAARAYVAPISIWSYADWRNDAAVQARVRAAAEEGLTALPPSRWHEILESLLEFSALAGGSIFDDKEMIQLIESFILDPASSPNRPSNVLLSRVGVVAIFNWSFLPDRACGRKSKFDVFSDRFELSFMCREVLHADLIAYIGECVVRGEVTLNEVVRRNGLVRDVEALREIEDHIWHRAVRTISTQPEHADAILSHAAQSVRLRNRVAIYRAGTTDIPLLERV